MYEPGSEVLIGNKFKIIENGLLKEEKCRELILAICPDEIRNWTYYKTPRYEDTTTVLSYISKGFLGDIGINARGDFYIIKQSTSGDTFIMSEEGLSSPASETTSFHMERDDYENVLSQLNDVLSLNRVNNSVTSNVLRGRFSEDGFNVRQTTRDEYSLPSLIEYFENIGADCTICRYSIRCGGYRERHAHYLCTAINGIYNALRGR